MEKITLYYFIVAGSLTLARGENVKLLLEDAGLEHEYVRIERNASQERKDAGLEPQHIRIGNTEYEERKAKLVEEGLFSPTLPYIEVGGKRFGKTVPIMRYISSKLGNKYHGSTDEENHILDSVAEMSNDWFESLKWSYFGTEEQKTKHKDVNSPNYIKLFEKYYSIENGPYILGDKLTYADILIYHLIDDDQWRNRLTDYPNLTKFVETFEQRPNIKKYLATLKK